MECYCYLRNVQHILADWKTLYERRFGEPFKGPIEMIARGFWKGDIMNADLEELDMLDTSEMYLRRINAKVVLMTERK